LLSSSHSGASSLRTSSPGHCGGAPTRPKPAALISKRKRNCSVRAYPDEMEPAAPEGFRGAGRRRAPRVAGPTGKPFDEPAPRNPPALRVASWRAPGSLRRSPDGIASRPARVARNIFAGNAGVAPRLPGARARAQRSRSHLIRIGSRPRLRPLISSWHRNLWITC